MDVATALERSAKLVFAGALVVVFDFEINRFDLINDAVGVGLVVAGLWRLQATDVAPRWTPLALAAGVVWFLMVAVMQVVTIPGPLSWIAATSALATTVLGALAFRDACHHLALDRAASSWSTSLRLAASIWGGLLFLGLVAMAATGGAFYYEGPWAIPVIILGFVPAVHLMISLGRTASQANGYILSQGLQADRP